VTKQFYQPIHELEALQKQRRGEAAPLARLDVQRVSEVNRTQRPTFKHHDAAGERDPAGLPASGTAMTPARQIKGHTGSRAGGGRNAT
jgi:hypothetical protein